MQVKTKEFQFTKERLNKIDPPKLTDGAKTTAKEYYYDAKCSALAVRVSSNGTKSFVAYRWDPAKKRTDRTTIGRYDANAFESGEFTDNPLQWLKDHANPLLTIDMARRLALAVIGADVDIKGEKVKAATEPTLQDLFDQYVERHLKKSGKKTWEEQVRIFDRWLSEWRDLKVSSIDQTSVEQLHYLITKKVQENPRNKKDTGRYVANRVIQLLRAVFNKAKTWKLLTGDNPASGITLYDEKPRERFLTAEEFGRLWDVIQHPSTPRNTRDLILLCIFTGIRKANALSLRWQHINWQARVWIIPETKNGTSQVVSLTEHEVILLQQRIEYLKSRNEFDPDGFCFPGPGQSGHMEDPKKSWTTVRTKAMIQDVHLHDLRRSLGSWMASSNVNVSLIQNALNHKDIKTTMAVYARTAKDAERAGRETAHRALFIGAGIIAGDDAIPADQPQSIKD